MHSRIQRLTTEMLANVSQLYFFPSTIIGSQSNKDLPKALCYSCTAALNFHSRNHFVRDQYLAWEWSPYGMPVFYSLATPWSTICPAPSKICSFAYAGTSLGSSGMLVFCPNWLTMSTRIRNGPQQSKTVQGPWMVPHQTSPDTSGPSGRPRISLAG